MENPIKALVEIAGKALEQEDRYILHAMRANPQTYSGEKSGSLGRGFIERDYQYIVWRALVSSVPYIAGLEQEDRNDLVLRYPHGNPRKPFAVVELKTWFSNNGEAELPKIKRDVVNKLRHRCKGEWGIMMVFSHNLLRKSEYWRRKLTTYLGVEKRDSYLYKFQTYDMTEQRVEFCVYALKVKAPNL